jgi:hypothetical protein
MPCGGQRLIQRAENHRKHDAKCIVKARNGLVEQVRMLFQSRRYPGMRQLQ